MQSDNVIRETSSVCPRCLAPVKADIVEREGAVYMVKTCRLHGDFQLLVSRHPGYYRQLSDFYFSLMTESFPQRDYIVHLTNRCNLRCPICLANANELPEGDYPLDSLARFLKGRRNCKIDLMGAEPTVRQDLPQIIRMVRKSGNIPALHTNGIMLAGFSYLEGLKKAGLGEVHLQFDGFDDAVYQAIRGERLLQIKLQALENLERLRISTDLKVTVVRGINEGQMSKVIDYAAGHSFVKEVFFLGCRYLGRAKDSPPERCMMPDELIDVLEEQTAGRISRENVLGFQRLYFSLLANFSVKKCFYNQHYLIMRNGRDYLPVDDVVDLRSLQAGLQRFRALKVKGKRLAFFYLPFILILAFLKSGQLNRLKNFIPLASVFLGGFKLSRVSQKGILIGFISACDRYSFDYQVAKNCGKGAVSVTLGVQDIGAMDNILRDDAPAKGESS